MTAYKLNALYFSPTGGTKAAITTFVKKFSDSEKRFVDMTLPASREEQITFTDSDLVVVANPVYAGQMPLADLWQNIRGHNTPCVILACYGNRHYDDCLAQMRRILTEQGFCVIAAAAPVIPHIFAPRLGAGRPNEEDEKILAALASGVCKKLADKNWRQLMLTGNPFPQPKQIVPVPKSFNVQQCTRCGTCVRLCPKSAIDRVSLAVDDRLCISCMRCIKCCPVQARSFDASVIRARLESNFSAPRKVDIFL